MLYSAMKGCQCEHASHFDPCKRTPFGNPGHKYDQKFFDYFIVRVKTLYGELQVCKDCHSDCHRGCRLAEEES